nr:ORF3 [Torque teno midi virus]
MLPRKRRVTPTNDRNNLHTRRDGKPPAQKVPAAAAAQAPPAPQTHRRVEKKTIKLTTYDRTDGVKLFQTTVKTNKKFTGWGKIIERECAAAFHRPPRTYMGDTPFYPWVVPEPVVNFHLNYKF